MDRVNYNSFLSLKRDIVEDSRMSEKYKVTQTHSLPENQDRK